MLDFLITPLRHTGELTLLSTFLRLLVAAIIGGIIGVERGHKNRPAGLRTYMLVCMGAAAVMITNQYTVQIMGSGDPVRMGAQVVSGIGFLGAGSIMVTNRYKIRGLTTAAGLWASGCIGLAVGIGFYEIAIISVILMVFILSALNRLDNFIRRNSRGFSVYIELEKKQSINKFVMYLKDGNLSMSDFELDHNIILDNNIISFIATIHSDTKSNHDEILAYLNSFEDLVFLTEL